MNLNTRIYLWYLAFKLKRPNTMTFAEWRSQYRGMTLDRAQVTYINLLRTMDR